LAQALLLSKQPNLLSLDPGFKVELSFMCDMVGKGGESRLHERFRGCLPSMEKNISIDAVLQQGAQLSASALFKFCIQSAQGTLHTCLDMLHKMKAGRPPQLPKDTSANVNDFVSRLQFFCRTTAKEKVKGKKELVTKELVGHDAIQEIWVQLKAKDQEQLKLDELQPLHVYSFLMSTEDQKAAFQLTHEMLNQPAGEDGKGKTGKGSRSSGSGYALNSSELFIRTELIRIEFIRIFHPHWIHPHTHPH